MKRGLEVFTSNQTGALRISLAFIFTAIIGFRRFRNLKKEDLQSLILVGLLGSGFPYFLLPLSISRLDSSIVGVLGATVPLFTLVIGVIGFKLAYKRYQLWGVLIGLAGTALLLLPNTQTGWSGQVIYGSYALIASICYGTCINIIHAKLRHLDSVTITLISMGFVGVPCIVFLFATGLVETIQTQPGAFRALGFITILALLGTSFAVILFNHLIRISSPVFSASVTYIVPLIAILWGISDGEKFELSQAAGFGIVLSGVCLANKR